MTVPGNVLEALPEEVYTPYGLMGKYTEWGEVLSKWPQEHKEEQLRARLPEEDGAEVWEPCVPTEWAQILEQPGAARPCIICHQ